MDTAIRMSAEASALIPTDVTHYQAEASAGVEASRRKAIPSRRKTEKIAGAQIWILASDFWYNIVVYCTHDLAVNTGIQKIEQNPRTNI
jgi:hypothetical protein